MKHNLAKILIVALGGLAISLPTSACGIEMAKKADQIVVKNDTTTTPTFVDPVRYETPKPVSYETARSLSMKEDPEPSVVVNKVILHYHNDDNNCNTRRFYTWVTGVDGAERKNDTTTPTDISLTMDFAEYHDYANMPSIFFIVKVMGTWAGQSEDIELVYNDYADIVTEDGTLEVWCVPGEGTAIDIYRTEAETQFPKITTAKFTSFNTIDCTCTIDKDGKKWVPSVYRLYAFDKTYQVMTDSAKVANKHNYLFKTGSPGSNTFTITLNYKAKINVQYLLESEFTDLDKVSPRKIIVSCENLYENERFEQFYTYSGNDLGVTYSPTSTTFKVWSPVSALVQLYIYDRGDPASLNIPGGSDDKTKINMYYTKGGVWEVTVLGDLAGKFYTYSLVHSAGQVEAVDPYAKAVGINGMRGFIYDKTSADANPDGWDTVPLKWDGVPGYDITTNQELSIYEVQIRDLTMDETWVSNKGNKRGTYSAFSEAGTTYSQNGKTVTTGFDHIKDLGVKAIQLMPVFDADNDERPEKLKYNWGYNPLNYNCVDGAYSSDPLNPLARIKEYKNLVKAYSENGNHTRVIMDVVFNHVSSASSSCFTKTMPKYYFRYDENWAYYDGSGCSNEVKTEATMMSKYIVDSLVWWATEYKIKGFRFDLMGLIDSWTMRAVKETLYSIDPDIVVYGEGWTAGGYHGKTEYDPVSGALINGGCDNALVYSQLYASSTSPGQVGGFNNCGRDSLKGGNDDGFNGNPYPQWGFMSQGSGDIGEKSTPVRSMLMGGNDWAGANPQQTINYASCHDNYTLWDQYQYTLSARHDGPHHEASERASVADLVAASLATHASIMLSNGMAFIQGGEEVYRTKSYSYVTDEEWEHLTDDATTEAILRPFPDYPHYIDPKDPHFGDPIASDDVRFYNDKSSNPRNIVSHNSYKSPDTVNSFKWDRKISVEGTSTYEYNEIWQKIIKTRNDISTATWGEIEAGQNKIDAWGNYDGATALGLWTKSKTSANQRYVMMFAGRSGGTLNWGGMSIASTVISIPGKTVDHTGDNFSIPGYGLVVYKINN